MLLAAGSFLAKGKLVRPFDWTVQAYEAALWARSDTGPDDIFGMKDAGIFGYFSERRVVNLDGVANDARYQEILRKGTLEEYLDELGVAYIAQHAVWYREDVVAGDYSTYVQEYPCRKYDGTGDSIELARENEVYRSPVYFDGAFDTVFLSGNSPAFEGPFTPRKKRISRTMPASAPLRRCRRRWRRGTGACEGRRPPSGARILRAARRCRKGTRRG